MRLRGGWVAVLLLAAGCAEELQPTPPQQTGQTFGEKFFTISCQRVAYTSSLRGAEVAQQAHLQDSTLPLLPVDVSGTRYRLACRLGPNYLPADARAHDPKVATIAEWRTPMAEAVNLIFPGGELSDLQDYMIGILPLTDNDSFPALVRTGAAVLGDMAQDQDLHWGLARLDGRVGYRPRKVCLGVMRELIQYPELHGLLSTLVELVAEGGKGHEAFLGLTEALSFELRTTRKVNDPTLPGPIHPGDKERSLKLGLDLLLATNPSFAAEQAPLMLVRRDWRGLAQVRRDPASGQVPAPFVDADKDGIADVNSLGRFETQNKQDAPAPFRLDQSLPDTAPERDPDGRALDGKGSSLYEYVNLDQTLLAALARDTVELLTPAKDTAFKLVLGLSGLLGGRKPVGKVASGVALAYSGFDTARAPLLDLVHGMLQALRDPAIDGTLEGVGLLLKSHEPAMARTVGAALDARERGKKHPEAQIEPQSNLYDDLIVVVRKIASKPGLLEDLIHALADPRSRNVAGMLENYFTYRDVHLLDNKTMKIINPTYKDKVDRAKPDSGHDRSIQQRLFHIINNTHGMKMCNKEGAVIKLPLIGITLAGPFKACELFQIDNGALFYTQSIARLRDANGKLTGTPKGNLRLKLENMPSWLSVIVKSVGEDMVLNMLSGIDGMSSHPTTEAVNRLMFLDPLPTGLVDVQNPAIDIDGHAVNKYHLGTLLSWEVPHPQYSCSTNDPCQFYDALRPMVQAFADHEAEVLFLDVLSVLHRHWASRKSATFQFKDPKAPDFAWGSAAVTYEPLIIEVLGQGDLLPALNAFSTALDGLKLADGTAAKAALAKTVGFLVDAARSPGLKYRDGRTTALASDGKTSVGAPSVFYLLADAFAAKRQALADLATGANKRLADAWNDSSSDLVDLFLTVQGKGTTSQFKNRRLVPAGQLLVDFLRARVKSHRAKGDVDVWLGQTLPQSVEEALAGPVVARAADFLRIVDLETKVKEQLYGLLDYLIDELKQNAAFRSSITGVADLLQLLLDDEDLVPAARAVGRAIDPQRGLLKSALRFLKPALAADVVHDAKGTAVTCTPGSVSCPANTKCVPLSSTQWGCSKQTLTRILRNAYQEQAPGKSPVQTLLDLATELHRLNPGEKTPYTGPDFGEALRQSRDFLANTETGLEKFFEIVKSRCGGSCQTAAP